MAALLTIPAIVIEQSATREPWPTIATVLNWTIWLAFLGEIVVMLAVVPERRRWLLRHPLEVTIVVLTPPFLPAGLQAARAFRLLRLLRLVKAAALTRRLLSTEGVRDASVLALVTVLGGGAAFAAVEKVDVDGQHLSTWDGIWWAIGTVTTVGYGGPPRTDAGRAIAIVVMLVGIGFVAILTAAAADRFLRVRRRKRTNSAPSTTVSMRSSQGLTEPSDRSGRRAAARTAAIGHRVPATAPDQPVSSPISRDWCPALRRRN